MSIWLPTGHSWRELWESRLISGVNWRSSVPDGKLLTMTNCVAGAERRSTSSGIQFVAGVATSNVEFVDPYDAVNNWWCSFRFKLDSDFSSAATEHLYLIGKRDGGNDQLVTYLDKNNGYIYLLHEEGGAQEICTSAQVSWTAGVWYHVILSCSTTTGQRVRVDNGIADTEVGNTTAISLAADMSIGARGDGATTDGFAGVIQDVFMGNTILTSDQETDIFNGIPPADTVNAFKFNEGGGSVAHDDGSGADDGTLNTSCTWAWDKVQQPVASFAGIDQYAINGSNLVDLSGAFTAIWVGKMKSVYSGLTRASGHGLLSFYIDANNYCNLVYAQATDAFVWSTRGGGSIDGLTITTTPAIDDYWIAMYTKPADGGTTSAFVNGVLQDTGTAYACIGAGADAYLGRTVAADYYDVSEPITAGLVEGSFNINQVRAVTKNISDRLGLGISV